MTITLLSIVPILAGVALGAATYALVVRRALVSSIMLLVVTYVLLMLYYAPQYFVFK